VTVYTRNRLPKAAPGGHGKEHEQHSHRREISMQLIGLRCPTFASTSRRCLGKKSVTAMPRTSLVLLLLQRDGRHAQHVLGRADSQTARPKAYSRKL
jgi:hypothetical protein